MPPQAGNSAQRLRRAMPHHHRGPGKQVHARLRHESSTYRSTGGFGIRLDGGMGYAGAVITPFYDSLLVKITAFGRRLSTCALQRMDRALREFRIRGVKTNIPFLENVIHNPNFRSGQATTTLIDTTPELFDFKPRRDRATKLLNFLGDVIVNGNPQAKGYRPRSRLAGGRAAGLRPQARPAAGHAPVAARTRARANSPNGRCKQKRLLITDTTLRDAHQSLLATRAAHLRHAGRAPTRWPAARRGCSAWKCGAAPPSTPPCASCTKTRGTACACLRERIPNICFQMLFRGSNAVGYSNYPDNVVAGFVRHAAAARHGHFPHLRFAQLPAQSARWPWRPCRRRTPSAKRAICYTGDILDPARDQVFAEILRQAGPGTGENGRAFPGHQGHGRLVPALRRPRAGQGAQGGNRPARFISTPTTPAASTPPRSSRPAKRAWTWRTWPSPRCPAPPASPTSIPSSPPCATPRATPGWTWRR